MWDDYLIAYDTEDDHIPEGRMRIPMGPWAPYLAFMPAYKGLDS